MINILSNDHQLNVTWMVEAQGMTAKIYLKYIEDTKKWICHVRHLVFLYTTEMFAPEAQRKNIANTIGS